MNSMAILQANEMALPKPFLEQNNIRPKKSRRIQSITILSKDKNYPSNRQLYVRTMLIAEIKDFLQKGFLTWRYKANVLVNPDNSDYHPIAVDYTFNPPFYQLFDYSLSIHNLLQTPEIINTTEVTRCIWQEKNYKKYNLSLLTLPQAKDIIKRNEMLITKLNSILIQNKLIEQINAVPTT